MVMQPVKINRNLNKSDLIVIGGRGWIYRRCTYPLLPRVGLLEHPRYDKKPLPEWYQRIPGVECLSMDLSERANAIRAVEGAVEVTTWQPTWWDGFIEKYRVECLRSILINTI